MPRLSLHAKDLILELLYQGFDLKQIKEAMEDGAFLSEAGISQELSEEVHFFCVDYEGIG